MRCELYQDSAVRYHSRIDLHEVVAMFSHVLALLVMILFHVYIYQQVFTPGYVKALSEVPGLPEMFYFGSTLKYHGVKREGEVTIFCSVCSVSGIRECS